MHGGLLLVAGVALVSGERGLEQILTQYTSSPWGELFALSMGPRAQQLVTVCATSSYARGESAAGHGIIVGSVDKDRSW